MTDIMAVEPIRIRDCACPGSPHADGDFVRLRPKLTMAGGVSASFIISANERDPVRLNALLGESLMVSGIGWWNLVQEVRARKDRTETRPISLNEQTIVEQITWGDGAELLFNRLTELYGEALFGKATGEADQPADPLVATPSEPTSSPTISSSGSGPTAGSTSASPPSSGPPRRPSRSSSPASTATAP